MIFNLLVGVDVLAPRLQQSFVSLLQREKVARVSVTDEVDLFQEQVTLR